MLTPIGHDVITACASQRAGLVRSQELAYHLVSEESGEDFAVHGHPIVAYTEGFDEIGRWIRIGQACIHDLIRYGTLPRPTEIPFWNRTGLIAAVPMVVEDRFLLPPDDVEDTLRTAYLEPLCDLLELPILPEKMYVVEMGHCATTRAVLMAQQLIQEGHLERAVILAVDSYVNPRSLDWLAAFDSLKTPDHSDGAIPGEGGACFMLETEQSMRQRHGMVGPQMLSAHCKQGREYEVLEPKSMSNDLAQSIRQVVHGQTASLFTGDIYLDLNGENWKAETWGHTQIQLLDVIDFEQSKTIFPCISFGETGAASGALAVCLAVRALARGYAGGRQSLICSLNDFGDTSALLLAGA